MGHSVDAAWKQDLLNRDQTVWQWDHHEGIWQCWYVISVAAAGPRLKTISTVMYEHAVHGEFLQNLYTENTNVNYNNEHKSWVQDTTQ